MQQGKMILAFGNPVYDIISTPALRRVDPILSGCSTNACLASVKLGEHGIIVGTCGPDFSERLMADLNDRGVQSYLYPSQQTGGFSLIYDERGNRKLDILGIAAPIPVSDDNLPDADFILFGPILGEVSTELAQSVIDMYPNTPVLLDPQGLLRQSLDGKVIHAMTDEFKSIASLSTIIKANEVEALVATGIDPRLHPERAVHELYEYGGKIAIVTLAEAGSVIFDGETVYHIPPFTTNAIDPTGAGDTYAAGFMVKYLESRDMIEVGCFASSVASIMVENSGPDFPLTLAEANRRTDLLLSGDLKLKL